MKKRAALSSIALVIGLLSSGWHSPTLAQAMLEEVIVTAQKREQSLQDVPIAVQAFSGKALKENGIQDIFDLQVSAPSLMVDQNQTAATSTFAVRGLGGGGGNFGIEPSVGMYVDGIYRSRADTMINQLVDIQTVEVLRGPQGTLFGRNTLSGAVHFKTVAPDHNNSGFIDLNVGNYNLATLSGAASFSVKPDILALRVAMFNSQRDGWIDNVNTPGEDEIFDRDRQGARLQALWTPDDNLSIRTIIDYAELDESCCGATGIYDNNRPDLRNGFGFSGTDALIEPRGYTLIPEERIYDRVMALSQNPLSKSRDRGLSIQVDWRQNEHTLTSITGWRRFNSFDQIDADFSSLDALIDTNIVSQRSFSQELRAAFTGEQLSYVTGAYYFTQDFDSDSNLSFGEDTDALASVSFFHAQAPFLANPLVLAASQYPLAPFRGFIADASGDLFFPPDGFATDFNRQDHTSWAIFGQADWQFNEQLTITAGLRYSKEKKQLTATYIESGNEAAFHLEQFSPVLSRADFNEPPKDDEQITGTLKLSWFASDTAMLYASYSTGYKAGGTNTDRIPPAFDQTFEAETSQSVEVGLKIEFPAQAIRLNVALHYTPVDDYQVATFTGTTFNVQNAATVETYGGEIEFLWQATDTLTLQASYALAVANFDEFEKGNCWTTTPFRTGVRDPGGFYNVGLGDDDQPIYVKANDPRVGVNDQPTYCDRSGGRLGTNPENFIVVSARKEFALNDTLTGFIKGEYSWYDDMILDQSNDPLSLQNAYALANLRIGIFSEDQGTELTFWGRNIFDEEYNGTAFPGPLQDGRLNGYAREPRTFGMSFRKTF